MNELKGYEALTMLTRAEQRAFYAELKKQDANLKFTLFCDYKNVPDFIASNIDMAESIKGADYWLKVKCKYN